MSLSVVGAFPIGGINVSAAGAITVTAPVLGQFDLSLTGPFGLGALQSDLTAQFQAAVSAQFQLALSLGDPFASIQASLTSLSALQASLLASLSIGLPAVSADIGINLAAAASIAGSLKLKLAGINALLDAALSVKLPAVNFLADLSASLSAGPVVLLSFSGDSLTATGGEIQAQFGAGLPGISPGDTVYGILLCTKSLSAWAGIQATFRTS